MSGRFRWAGSAVVALLAGALVLGVNGFDGAVHSVHHLPAAVDAHARDDNGKGHDERRGSPVPAPEDPCSVATAASHPAATAVGPPAAPALAPAPLEPVALRTHDAPRIAWLEPGPGRAPPSLRRIPG